MAFFGEYEISVTAGGRIVIPKKIRKCLKGKLFVITKGFNNCLAGYDKQDWGKRSSQLLDVSLLDNEMIAKRRYIFSSQNEVEIDEQGRIVIPKNLYQAILKQSRIVIIIGVGEHFEIWNKDAWHSYLKEIKM